MTTAAIIQARIGSNRLPGKVALELYDSKSMLWWVIQRVKKVRLLDMVILATPDTAKDNILKGICADTGIYLYQGSENDVLDRYAKAALRFNVDVIVRVTADCPFIDPDVITKSIRFFNDNTFEYVSTVGSYPDGLDTEIFSITTLYSAWKGAKSNYHREHVTPYIRESGLYTIGLVPSPEDLKLKNYHWSVDTMEDFNMAVKMYERLKYDFRLADVVKLVDGGIKPRYLEDKNKNE